MLRRLILLAVGTAAFAACDLAAKAKWSTPPELLHGRSTAWVLSSLALASACLVSAFASSRLVRAAGALCAGGLVGNLVSALSQGGQVPDPFLLGGAKHGIAFNLADLFFLLGLVGLVGAALLRPLSTRDSLPKTGGPGISTSHPESSDDAPALVRQTPRS